MLILALNAMFGMNTLNGIECQNRHSSVGLPTKCPKSYTTWHKIQSFNAKIGIECHV